jgi:hypothetical protein
MAARVTVGHPEQGWSLLCNGVVLFDDAGALLPDGSEVTGPVASIPRQLPWAASAPRARALAVAA